MKAKGKEFIEDIKAAFDAKHSEKLDQILAELQWIRRRVQELEQAPPYIPTPQPYYYPDHWVPQPPAIWYSTAAGDGCQYPNCH